MAADRVTQTPVIPVEQNVGSARATQIAGIAVDSRKNNCRVTQLVVIPLTPGPTNPAFSLACPEWLREFPDTMLLDIAGNDAIFPYNIRQCALNFLQTRAAFAASKVQPVATGTSVRKDAQVPFIPIARDVKTFPQSEAAQLPDLGKTLI